MLAPGSLPSSPHFHRSSDQRGAGTVLNAYEEETMKLITIRPILVGHDNAHFDIVVNHIVRNYDKARMAIIVVVKPHSISGTLPIL